MFERIFAGNITKQMPRIKQCIEIAREKGEDLNAFDDNAAGMIIAGTARSMGVEVDGAPLAKNSKHKKI